MVARSVFALTLGLFVLSGCDACGDDLQRVAPKIEIGDPLVEEGSYCNENRFRDCAISFGDAATGQGMFATFVIENPSPVDLLIESIELTLDSDPAFEIVTVAPTRVETQKLPDYRGEEIVVRFAPQVEGTVTGTIVIKSDAANLNEDEDVVIRLTGNGLDLGRPEIVVTPAECNFGDVGVGVTAFCDLTIENQGTRDLEIQGVGFTAETDLEVFGAQTVIPIPSFVAPGTGMSVRLYANPQQPGVVNGGLTLTSNDRDTPETVVPMSVNGAQAPTAIAEILSVNGVPYDGSAPIGPLDDVIITGTNSVPALPEDDIVAYRWEIVNRPNDSSVELSDPSSVNTGFFFESAGGNFQGLDVVGSYTVRLTVVDSNGAESTNEGTVSINAIPLEALHVQLTWDIASGDMDLHMVKDDGDYCSSDACYFANCKPTSFSSPPEWDGVSGRGAGDPFLDVDDLSGYGPENINVDAPVNGTYTVSVAYYSGSEPTWVTAKIFINGALQYESSREFSDGDYWDVAEVDWNNGAALITPIDGSNQPAGSCFGF